MKRVIGIIAALGIIANLGSCKKPINCTTPVISKILFYSSISTYTVPDTTATLEQYRKNTLFTQLSQRYPSIRLAVVDFNKRLYLPNNGVDTYDYDWIVTLHPSGKTYAIRGVSHQSSTSTTSDCTNTVTYYVNDSLVTVPGDPYSSVPNFVPDIEIKYN